MKTLNIVTKIVIICVICAVTIISGCVTDDNLGTTPTPESTPIVIQKSVQPPKITPTSAPTPIAVGTYYNPIPKGKKLICNEGFEMGVLSVLRGEEVNTIVRNTNMFNDKPKSGHEYMIMFAFFKNTGNNKQTLSGYDFKAFANNVECDDTFVVLPDDFEDVEFGIVDVMPGGLISGTKLFEVPVDVHVIICYDRSFNTAYYFDAGTENFN